MAREDYLFAGPDWSSVSLDQWQQMASEIEGINADRLLNTSVEDLAQYFVEKYSISAPELDIDELVVDSRERQIDVSRDLNRHIIDRSQPTYIAGTEVEVEIPFNGEAEAFNIRPNPYRHSPPRAKVKGSTITFSIIGTSLNESEVRGEIDRTVESIQWYLTHLRNNVASLNSQLVDEARTVIETRRDKLLASRNMVASLGFKMKVRDGKAKTFVAPEIKRKLTPIMPQAGTVPYNPESTLSSEEYEYILGIMGNMTQVMERSPSAFYTIDEEALRTHFLVQLNGVYEGQATGETFNFEGKTDILVRSEGRNIFIAECKFWVGAKKLTETIDQLLGYSSWRDTKTAIVVFNRNRNLSNVLATIPKTVQAHPQYKQDLPGSTESSFRYRFASRDDRNRELNLTVMVFDVPTLRQ